MTVFVATPSSMTPPVRMYHYIEESIDPLVASVSTVVILLTFLLMAIVDRIYGLGPPHPGRQGLNARPAHPDLSGIGQ